MSNLEQFRQRLRNRRKEMNMTQSQLGNICGVSAQEISHFENGRRAPELEMFIKMCNALDTSPNALLWDYFDFTQPFTYGTPTQEQVKAHVSNAMRELARLEEYYNL